jgi:hypothetical protein
MVVFYVVFMEMASHCMIYECWCVRPGHPIGATGLAQCAELVMQLRGEAGQRQVDDASVALQHNFGIGGAAVVSLYRRPDPTSFVARAKL